MRWWHIPIALVVGFLFALAWRRNPLKQIGREFGAIDDAIEAKKVEAEKGALVARRMIEAKHAEAIKEFDEMQEAKAASLRDDPAALARWFKRISD